MMRWFGRGLLLLGLLLGVLGCGKSNQPVKSTERVPDTRFPHNPQHGPSEK
jgi:hypothetical protein